MRTRSEWFLGARGGSLELCPENLRPSTSIAGTIGSYNIINIHAQNSNRIQHARNNNLMMVFFTVLDFLF